MNFKWTSLVNHKGWIERKILEKLRIFIWYLKAKKIWIWNKSIKTHIEWTSEEKFIHRKKATTVQRDSEYFVFPIVPEKRKEKFVSHRFYFFGASRSKENWEQIAIETFTFHKSHHWEREEIHLKVLKYFPLKKVKTISIWFYQIEY